MKAVLLENHPLLRAGLAQLLAHPTLGLEVSAPALPASELGELQPVDMPADLLVVSLDEVDAPVDAAQLREAIARSGAAQVLVLAARPSPEEAHVVMTCGVDAYAAKSQSPDVLLATLRLVLAGGQSYPALMPRAAVAVPMLTLDAAEAAQRLSVSLRQYEVLVLLSRGNSVKGVGRLLGISEATVKTHACTLYRRLNVRNKSEAVYAAMRLGIPLELQGGVVATVDTPATEMEDETAFVRVASSAPHAVAPAADVAMVSSRPAGPDLGAESRWAAMTRVLGGGAPPAKPMRTPVRTANGTARLG